MASKINIEKDKEQHTTVEVHSGNENSTASAHAEGSIHVDSTNGRESQSTSELSPNNSDSLTDGYVHVDQVPATESEEIRNLSNQPSVFSGCLEYVSSISFPLPSTIMPRWLPYTTGDGETTTDIATNEDQTDFDVWVREMIRGTFTGSIEEESRFRDCLVRAISDHFDGMNHLDKNLLTQVCRFSREEICYARESESQFTRRLLLMLLRRDTKTILSVLFHLYTQAKDVVEKAISSLHRYLEDGHRKQFKCCRCLLKERVCICLIVDHLPTCDSEFLSFVNVVSEENQPVQPSVSLRLWSELFNIITNQNLHGNVNQLLINVIESCGYHSDIVRMLKEDAELKRNSFLCRCQERAACMGHNCGPQQEQSLTTDLQDGTSESNEPHGSTVAAGTERIGHIGSSAAFNSDMNTSTEMREGNLNNSGESTNIGNVKRHSYKEERRKRQKNPPKRKQPDSKTEDEVLKKKPPDISVVNINSSRPKRKDISRGNEFNGKKLRNSLGGEAGPSSFGNCNLQMELLKIGVPGYENQPDSGVCLPSTSSEGDSGVYDHTAMSSRSVGHEETASKQIHVDNDLRPSTQTKSDDQSGNGDLIKNHTSSEEEQENMLASNHNESENLSQVQTDQNTMEEICSAESLNSSEGEQSPNEYDSNDPTTMMP